MQKVEGIVGTKRIFMVDPKAVIIEDGWNPRIDYSGQDDMIASVKEKGVIQPILLQRKNDKLILRDGERRLRAIITAIDDGYPILSIPAKIMQESADLGELLIENLGNNRDVKTYLPVEEAAGYKRLIDWGWDITRIAKRRGRSYDYIRSMLLLLDGCSEVQKAVNEKTLGKTLAQNIIHTAKGDKDLERDLVKEVQKGKEGKKVVKNVLIKRQPQKEERKELAKRLQDLITDVIGILEYDGKKLIKLDVIEKLEYIVQIIEKEV